MRRDLFRVLSVLAGMVTVVSGVPSVTHAQGAPGSAPASSQNPPTPPALPQPAYTVTVIETAPLPGVESADRENPRAGPDGDRRATSSRAARWISPIS